MMWLVFALLAAILWGVNYVLAERVLINISAFTILALEMLVGALIFSTLAYFNDLKKDLHLLATIPNLAWITTCEVAIISLASYFITLSIKSKNATMAGVVELTYPIFIIFFSWLIFGQNQLSFSVIIGGFLIFTGVFILNYYN